MPIKNFTPINYKTNFSSSYSIDGKFFKDNAVYDIVDETHAIGINPTNANVSILTNEYLDSLKSSTEDPCSQVNVLIYGFNDSARKHPSITPLSEIIEASHSPSTTMYPFLHNRLTDEYRYIDGIFANNEVFPQYYMRGYSKVNTTVGGTITGITINNAVPTFTAQGALDLSCLVIGVNSGYTQTPIITVYGGSGLIKQNATLVPQMSGDSFNAFDNSSDGGIGYPSSQDNNVRDAIRIHVQEQGSPDFPTFISDLDYLAYLETLYSFDSGQSRYIPLSAYTWEFTADTMSGSAIQNTVILYPIILEFKKDGEKKYKLLLRAKKIDTESILNAVDSFLGCYPGGITSFCFSQFCALDIGIYDLNYTSLDELFEFYKDESHVNGFKLKKLKLNIGFEGNSTGFEFFISNKGNVIKRVTGTIVQGATFTIPTTETNIDMEYEGMLTYGEEVLYFTKVMSKNSVRPELKVHTTKKTFIFNYYNKMVYADNSSNLLFNGSYLPNSYVTKQYSNGITLIDNSINQPVYSYTSNQGADYSLAKTEQRTWTFNIDGVGGELDLTNPPENYYYVAFEINNTGDFPDFPSSFNSYVKLTYQYGGTETRKVILGLTKNKQYVEMLNILDVPVRVDVVVHSTERKFLRYLNINMKFIKEN